jgi:hypothetical protein
MIDSSVRSDGRSANQLRPIRFQNNIAPNATGSTLVEWGNTRVICGVTVEETVPRWMKEQKVAGGRLPTVLENPPYGMIKGGGGNEVDGLMTFCHDARKGRYLGSIGLIMFAPPLYSTSTSAVEYPSSVSATGATALSEIGFSVENVITHAAEKSKDQSITPESASPLKKDV